MISEATVRRWYLWGVNITPLARGRFVVNLLLLSVCCPVAPQRCCWVFLDWG